MLQIPLKQLKRQAALPLFLTLLLCGAALPTWAQTFNSGSTGADGAFAPTNNQTVQVPASGVLNYTTVNIPSYVTITYVKNARNTPVTMLASGNITIAGTINLNGGNGTTASNAQGLGGAGGFDGGAGGGINAFGTVTYYGLSGDGPGGGGGGLASADGSGTILGGGGGGGFSTAGVAGAHHSYDGPTATDGAGGPFYGSTTLLQLIGGSGGGGGGSISGYVAGGGGGGGGAIVIASSGTISFPSGGGISAAGGLGGNYGNINYSNGYTEINGGGGAGGAVRLVATTLTGSPTVNVSGGRSGIDYYAYNQSSGHGGNGYARFEAYQFTSFQPSVSGPYLSNLAPTSVTLPNMPTLLIASVGSVPAPAIPKGDFNSPPDITLPSSATNPVTVAIAATNIPVGTVISVEVAPTTGNKTFVNSTPLTGNATASSATAGVTLAASLLSVLYAGATVNVTSNQTGSLPPLIINGERVKRIQVATTFGGGSRTTYVTESGRSYTREQLFGTLVAMAKKGPINTLVKK